MQRRGILLVETDIITSLHLCQANVSEDIMSLSVGLSWHLASQSSLKLQGVLIADSATWRWLEKRISTHLFYTNGDGNLHCCCFNSPIALIPVLNMLLCWRISHFRKAHYYIFYLWHGNQGKKRHISEAS